jgi:hypothetical protein
LTGEYRVKVMFPLGLLPPESVAFALRTTDVFPRLTTPGMAPPVIVGDEEAYAGLATPAIRKSALRVSSSAARSVKPTHRSFFRVEAALA